MRIRINEAYKNFFLNEGREEFLKNKHVESGKISPDLFDKIKDIDPTRNKMYLDWLCIQFIKNEIEKDKVKLETFFEDAYKMTEYLKLFDRLKHKYPQSDIFRYTLDTFKNASVELKKSLNPEELESGLEKAQKYKEYWIGNAAGYSIYEIPKGRKDLHRMSCELGSGTEWCTATGKTDTHFSRYIEQGPLFIIIKGKDKYQFHYESSSFKDSKDLDIF